MIDMTMLNYMDKLLKSKGFNSETETLSFGLGNSKLDDVITFSLPAGYSCPFAKDCRSCAIKNPRKRHDIGDRRKFIIKDGPKTQFRCSAAIDEALKPAVRESRWKNFLTLRNACEKGLSSVIDLLEKSLPPTKWNKPTRLAVSGDFFSQTYFDAWLEVIRRRPNRPFYGYTKALPFWIARYNHIPNNLILTASYGGTHDHLIKEYGLKSVKVVKSPEEAMELGLPIDHDDSLAMEKYTDFALVVHGIQPKGVWARAWKALVKRGMGGYKRA